MLENDEGNAKSPVQSLKPVDQIVVARQIHAPSPGSILVNIGEAKAIASSGYQQMMGFVKGHLPKVISESNAAATAQVANRIFSKGFSLKQLLEFVQRKSKCSVKK